ncbi:MAG: helix-turn-helix transcriptional regulator [Rectinemataceae bacterium]
MIILGIYSTIAVLLIATSATSLCLAYFDSYRRRASLWLSLTMTALVCFALSILGSQITGLLHDGNRSSPPPGPMYLLWMASGTILTIHALPRFILSAFGATPGRAVRILLDASTAIVAVLSAIRVATEWSDVSAVAAPISLCLRVFVFAFVGGAFALTIAFQSRLPDRSLYKTVIGQLRVLALLLPLIILEDVGQLREVLSGLLAGLGSGEIADRLCISPRTVENHLYRIYQKTGIKNRLQLYNLLRSD